MKTIAVLVLFLSVHAPLVSAASPVQVNHSPEKIVIGLDAIFPDGKTNVTSDRLIIPVRTNLSPFRQRLANGPIRGVELRSNKLYLKFSKPEMTPTVASAISVSASATGLEIAIPRHNPVSAVTPTTLESSGTPIRNDISTPRATTSPAPTESQPPVAKKAPPAEVALGPQLPVLPSAAPLSTPSGQTPWLSMLGALVIVVVGALWMKVRKNKPQLADGITISASLPLGPRNRLLLVQAGRRELLISVTDKQTRLLGQWRAQDALAERANSDTASATTKLPAARTRSAALTGILRLKSQHESTNSTDDGVDADWAAELLAATKSRGPRS